MKKVPFLRLRPVVLSLIVMTFLAAAWLPTGSFLPGERTNKPQLFLEFAEAVPSQAAEDVLFDVQQRIEQRHEWRMVEAAEPYAWHLNVRIEEGDQLMIHGVLTTPQRGADNSTHEQRFKIQGPYDAMGALPEQFVKVLIDLVENAEKHSASL
ncbi:hypothetical protein [Pseudidiomarina homiensis]|uniref:hypothetical protein n=1 Tax=Pseudidiomarina homiensis TaxID=364198 RepID=UPI00215AC4CA|nr:hypothetical protein [Pseudidiomarina homiensis]